MAKTQKFVTKYSVPEHYRGTTIRMGAAGVSVTHPEVGTLTFKPQRVAVTKKKPFKVGGIVKRHNGKFCGDFQQVKFGNVTTHHQKFPEREFDVLRYDIVEKMKATAVRVPV